MKSPINVLIVDDHPFIIQAYRNALNKYSEQGYEFTVTQAGDCKAGYETITDPKNDFQMAMFDISMPEYAEKGIRSGEDLAMLMHETMPECKVILLTMHSEPEKVNNIVRNINPSGLIIKNDITFDELIFAMDRILHEENYYSQTVIKLIGHKQNFDHNLDTIDTQIIYQLSKGVPGNELIKYIPLSPNSIENRKAKIKITLGVEYCSDEELVEAAKEKGII